MAEYERAMWLCRPAQHGKSMPKDVAGVTCVDKYDTETPYKYLKSGEMRRDVGTITRSDTVESSDL